MLYLLVILLAIILGVLFGTFKRKKLDISYIRLEKVWLAFLAFGIQTITRIFSMKGVSFLVKYSWLTQGVVFVLLFVALWYNRKHLGLWIIALGASLNALVMMVNGGRMPVSLEKLVKVDMPEFIELIKSGADINALSMDGTAPIHLAAAEGYIDVIKVLVEKGANVELEDSNQMRAVDIAAKNDRQAVVDFFKEKYNLEPRESSYYEENSSDFNNDDSDSGDNNQGEDDSGSSEYGEYNY